MYMSDIFGNFKRDHKIKFWNPYGIDKQFGEFKNDGRKQVSFRDSCTM